MKACIFNTHNQLWKIYLFANPKYILHVDCWLSVLWKIMLMTKSAKANYVLENISTNECLKAHYTLENM